MQPNARTSILAVSTAAVLFVSAGCGTAASPQEDIALALLSTYAAVPGNLQHLPGIALSFVDIATVERVEARQQVESEPLFALAPAEVLEEGGFSYHAPEGYLPTFRPGLVTLSSPDESVFVMLTGGSSNTDVDLESTVLGFAAFAGQNVISEMEIGESYPLSVQGMDGKALDVAGEFFASHIHGTIVALSPSVRQLFVAFAIGIEEGDNHTWQREGTATLQAVLDTLTFFEPVPMPAFCPLTADATYAYSPDNPVRVGGDFLEGPLRERAYLEHLRGPDGQPVAYERTGPFEYNGMMLDMYEVRYPGQAEPAVLYVDEYHFGPPKAPIGFSCEGQFPLRAP
jgi:hypothetical protein